jgi:hypothetical protein
MLSLSSHSLFYFFLTGHAVAEAQVIPFSIFFLTGHSVAEAQVIPFYFLFAGLTQV